MSTQKLHQPVPVRLFPYTVTINTQRSPANHTHYINPPAAAAALLDSHTFRHHPATFPTTRSTFALPSPNLTLALPCSSNQLTTLLSSLHLHSSSSSLLSKLPSRTSILTPNTMSSAATPIPAPRFAKALSSLSLSSLYLKAAELRNSIHHLEKSNAELEDYLRREAEADKELYEAILENRDVITRMEERIELVKKEVTDVRCLPWEPEEGVKVSEMGERSNGERETRAGSATNGVTGAAAEDAQERRNGAQEAGNEEEGVFL